MLVARALREVFRREAIPPRPRWWLAAAGMRDWYGFLAKRFEPHVGARARPLLADAASRTFERRYAALQDGDGARLPSPAADPRAVALFFGALYRVETAPKTRWLFDGMGGAARGVAEHARALRLVHTLAPEARWRETTVHLGELLIVLTEELPRELPHARRILSEICFEAGTRYARRMRRAWRLPDAPSDPAALAIEVLRTSEYLFRVNPEHWGATDPASKTGFLEGTACPWFDRPGWNGAHCGIFGQFQAGVASVFGLRYILGKTIPKNGGTTCRVDLKPLRPESLVRRGGEATR